MRFLDDAGPVERQSLSIRLDRTVSGGVHEDLDIVNYGAPAGAADDRGRDRLRLRRHLRRPGRRPRPPRPAQHPLVPLARRAPDGVRQRRLPARADRRGREGRFAAAVRQRPPRLRRQDPAEGRLAHLPQVAAADRLRTARAAGRRPCRATRSTSRPPARPAPPRGRDRDAELRPSSGPGTRRSATSTPSGSRTRRSSAASSSRPPACRGS